MQLGQTENNAARKEAHLLCWRDPAGEMRASKAGDLTQVPGQVDEILTTSCLERLEKGNRDSLKTSRKAHSPDDTCF